MTSFPPIVWALGWYTIRPISDRGSRAVPPVCIYTCKDFGICLGFVWDFWIFFWIFLDFLDFLDFGF